MSLDAAEALGTAYDDEPPWAARYRAGRVSLPDWATDAPDRCVYVGHTGGVFEVYAWDRATGSRRQVTSRPNGTSEATIDPAGEWIWWFADTDGDEVGVWMRQPFLGGPDTVAAPGVPAAYSAGLALGREGRVVVGTSDDAGTALFLCARAAEPVLVYRSAEDASVGDLSEDGTLLAITHSEAGDSRHPDLRVYAVAMAPTSLARPATVGELSDGAGLGLDVLGFSPVLGDRRLLIGHERRGRSEVAVWDAQSGVVDELDLGLPGEVSAQWYPDASALLVEHQVRGRTELYRYSLASQVLELLDLPPGLVAGATARPDGSVWASWSSSAAPPVVREIGGGPVLSPAGPAPATSVAGRDVDVPGPGGSIHALLSSPPGSGPFPGVVLAHGGPTWQDFDAFSAEVASYVDSGYAVVRVNYRGSTGYGSVWRDALEAAPGLVELEDLVAVRDHLVATGVLAEGRVALAGASWGGFLTLLGLGVQPGSWAVGMAAVPVADYVTAYADEMEGLRAFDRSLFGGSPAEVPEKYRASSPITYAAQVQAPLLVLAGANDPRCPLQQIENYLSRLGELGTPVEVYRFDAGHGSLVVEERIRQQRATLDFLARHLPA